MKKPEVGILVDVRDADYLWCPARVVGVVDNYKGGLGVRVHYTGWTAEEHDEEIEWKSERLVPLFTFSKQAKCLVSIMSKQTTKPPKEKLDTLPSGARKTHCTLWPCVVQLRMPHPLGEGLEDEAKCFNAEEYLKEQPHVFIRPFAPSLLPEYLQKANKLDGGRWVNVKQIRPWTNEPLRLGVLPKNFLEALKLSRSNSEVNGTLPPRAFEDGALLQAKYRVHSRTGSVLKDGSIQEVEVPERSHEEIFDQLAASPSDAILNEESKQEDEPAIATESLEPVPPPTLPPPIEITQSIYPDCGVKRCEISNQYTASACLGGNELFLGKFPTQTQAYQATRVAAGEDIQIETDVRKAQLKDLHSVPIEAAISAVENDYDPSVHSFSLHRHTMDKIRYEAYQTTLKAQQESKDGDSASQKQPKAVTAPPRKSKRKGTPRKSAASSS